jgi:hypothetical protein
MHLARLILACPRGFAWFVLFPLGRLPKMFTSCVFFLQMTLVCLNMFVTQRLDVAVIEVGVGGRADATTVVDVCVSFGFCVPDRFCSRSFVVWHRSALII